MNQFDIKQLTNGYTGNGTVPSGTGGSWSFLDHLKENKGMYLGNEEQAGILPVGIQALGGLAGAYTGIKQLGLQKDQFNLQKQYAATNLANQAKTVNLQLEDKYRRMLDNAQGNSTVDANSLGTLDQYLAKHGVSGKVGG